MLVAAQVLEERVEVVEARVGQHCRDARKRVVVRIGIMLDVQAQPQQEPLGHLDPEAVVAADRLLALVGDQLDDVLNVLDFVLRADPDAIEGVQVHARTVGRRRLELVDALAQAALLTVLRRASPPS